MEGFQRSDTPILKARVQLKDKQKDKRMDKRKAKEEEKERGEPSQRERVRGRAGLYRAVKV